MSTISVDYDVLNQKGSPAWFSDTFANIPTFGYKGRMFISIDTFAFYRDTGTGWDLIGGPGIGTLTGSGTTGQVSFFNGTQVLTGNNNLFWDNTNSRLGINTTTPGVALDIHATGTNAQFNGTGTSNAYLAFQNAGVSKWRIGNTYNAGANSFDIYNVGLTTTILSISSTTNTMTLSTNLTTTGAQFVQNGFYLSNANAGAQAFYTNMWGRDNGINFALRNLTGGAGFIFQSAASYDYTFPASAGTLALTSDLSSYLPLAGGTLTGALVINPTNTLTIGLDVASNTTRFRSDNTEGFKRQLEIVMGSGTLVQLTAKGYLANYGTDMAFYTATTSGTNASPGIYITGTNNRVGIKTGTPDSDLQVAGNCKIDSTLTSVAEIVLGGSGSYPTGGTGFRNDGTNLNIYYGSNNCIFKDTSNVERMKITAGGLVGINTIDGSTQLAVKSTSNTSSTYPLFLFNSSNTGVFHVRSDGYINTGSTTSSPYNLAATGRSAILDSGGGLGYLVSTRESKANIVTIKNIDFINQLNPVQFNYRKKDFNTNTFTDELYNNITYGFIADEVEKVNKELAFYNADGSLAGVEYNSMIAILTKAIQELNEKLVRNNIN